MTSEHARDSASGWHVALAVTSLAVAGIHFGVMGDHFQESVVLGLFFAVVAWAQAAWAVAVLVAPARRVLVAGAAGNLAVVLTWAISRTVGVPVEPHPWTAEAIGAADLASTILELAIVAGCGVLLMTRLGTLGARRIRLVPAVALSLGLVVLSSAAIATSGDHGHSGSDASGDPHTAEATGGSDDHAHELVGGSGEPDLAQIHLVRTAMRKYRDVKVAFADGWRKEHQDWPEIGAHFYNAEDWADSFPTEDEMDLLRPEYLMYSKFLTGEWKLVAVAYVVDQALYPDPPTELTGALYHEHVWNCIADGEELEEEDWGVISMEECEIMGGRWSPGGVWMTHVWLVDNPNGIFAETNPFLTALKAF
ncbi:MAG: hypothetical protein ACXWYQ_04090 [Actinomycetota bacterium]